MRHTLRALVVILSVGSLARLAPPLVAQPAGETPAAYDLLVKNGRLLDGSGNPWIRADVGVRGARIEAVGHLESATAARVVDASGLYVVPGFVDTHSHAGPGLGRADLAAAHPLLAQGITTVCVNPDGGGAVDLARQREGMLKHGIGVNACQLVPHGSVREAVLGSAPRLASPDELERMRALVRQGMQEGAWGLSSGPFYAPGSFSDTHELVELAKIAAEFHGVYQSHVRDESDYSVGVLAAVDEVITVAREARLPSIVTHVKSIGPTTWGFSAAIIMRIQRARDQGLEVWADHYPYTASATGLGAALLPRWAQAGGRAELQKRLADPATRAKIRAEMADNLARRGGADRIQFRRVLDDPSIEGRMLDDVARVRGVDPVTLSMTLLERGSPAVVSFGMHEDDVRRFLVEPWTMTASDGDLVPMGEGVPHPRTYGTFPRKIRKYVIDEPFITLEHAVRSMTSLPARVFGMLDRGELRPGAAADIVVFDLARVRDRATYTEPHQLADGMVHVFVNGRAAVADGTFTGERAGEVLRRGTSAMR